MQRMPTLFLSHGAPNIALYEQPARRFFDGLAASLPRPQAIVVASAHYAAAAPAVTTSALPTTIHDFSGFEPELYQMRYPAAGAPALAHKILALLDSVLGIHGVADTQWGFDHGAWSPLIRVFPAADVPVVMLSLTANADAAFHFRLGRALATLREDNILVLGSGSMTHNLGRLQMPMEYDARAPWVTRFLDWIDDHLTRGDDAGLCNYRSAAPHAHECHPTDEHLLPLFVALGAAGAGWRASNLHRGMCYGTLSMDAWRFD